MSALGGKAVAEVGLIFGIDINGKSQTKPNSSRLVGHVHPPFRARLQIWVKGADELTASCYRLLPRGGVIGRSMPSLAGLTRVPWVIWKKNLGMQLSRLPSSFKAWGRNTFRTAKNHAWEPNLMFGSLLKVLG